MPILTDEQVSRYWSDGWLAPIDVLTAGEASTILAALEEAETRYPEDLRSDHRNNAHLVLPFLADLALHPTILGCVASLVDEPAALLNSVLFIKDPDTTTL